MPLPIDATRAIRSHADLTTLVRAVRDAPTSETETNAFEWKSGLDLTSKAGCATIAKAVLGFSNRDPGIAARTFEGCAYLLAGVSPQELAGVAVADVASLEPAVVTYAGRGPRWSADYVELDGKLVLVVTVEAPRRGDPIHPTMKTYRPAERGAPGPVFSDGTVFVRHGAATDPATASDFAMLSARAAARLGEELQVTVRVAATSRLRRVDLSPAALERVVESERQRLEPSSGAVMTSALALMRYSGGEYRSEAGFREEVDEYLAELRQQLFERLVARSVLHETSVLRLELVNPTDTSFAGVRLQVRFPASVPVCTWKPERKKRAKLPRPPVPFGQARRDGPLGLGTPWHPDLDFDVRGPWVPEAKWDEEAGTFDVDFAGVEVRPQGTHVLPPLYLLLSPDEEESVTVSWEATAAAPVQKRLRGELVIPVGPDVVEGSALLVDVPKD